MIASMILWYQMQIAQAQIQRIQAIRYQQQLNQIQQIYAPVYYPYQRKK